MSGKSGKSVKTIRSVKNPFDISFGEEDTVLFEWYNLYFQVPANGEDVKDRLPGTKNPDEDLNDQNEK